MSNLRVLLVEDDELFRLGLLVRLQQEPGVEVVAEAVDGEMAVELTNQYLPDVVLLDVGLPGIGGVEACRQIKQRHPNIPVLILTSHFHKQLIERLVAAGASWWDAAGTAEIRAALTSYASVSEPLSQEPEIDLPNPLTNREKEILSLIAAGKTNGEIAEILHITVGTVRVHVHAI
jgi:DNA-binding NarL/FixJ family response regulator